MTISFRNRVILIIAPHPDDEVLGCGGLISRVKVEGGKVHVLCFTVGDIKQYGGHSHTEKRIKEMNKVMKYLKVDSFNLALVGKPIKGHIIGARPGHKSNIEFAKILKSLSSNNKLIAPKYNINKKSIYNINQIKNILKHRHPFLFVDKIIHIDEMQIIGIKNVTNNEHFFEGHFPNNPIMPGVIQIEALAQVGGILIMNSIENSEKYIPYLAGIENFRFRKMVLPGDTLILKSTFISPIKRGIAKMKSEAFVGDELVSEGLMTATIVKNK